MNSFHLAQLAADSIYLIVICLFAMMAKVLHDRTTSFDDDDEIEIQNNAAVGIRRAGVYLGLILGMLGPISGPSHGFFTDLWSVIVEGFIVTLLFIISGLVNERLVLPNINNDVAVKNGNVAVGMIEAGSYVAIGLILWGSFAGDGASLIKGMVDALIYFVLGQATLVSAVKIFPWLLQVDLDQEVNGNNKAAGLFLTSVLLAVGIILRASIAGPSESIGGGIASFAVSAVFGLVLLYFTQWATDLNFLRKSELAEEIVRDENIAAVSITAAFMVGIAFAVSVAVL